jgi:serine/threonine protein kinase
MLSPLATLSNLKDYWKNHQPRLDEPDFVMWMLRQLRGLASAVTHLYNLGGRHGDLKPENLLCFDEGDPAGPTIKIADFGSAKLRDGRSGPGDKSLPTMSYTQGTSAYEAPDYIILKKMSRAYDMWTLGGIFLDMLTWTFGMGYSEVEKFSNDRVWLNSEWEGSDNMFWYVEWNGEKYTTHWKPAVREKFDKLEALCYHDQRRAVFKELLLTTSKLLRMDPAIRPKPYEVHNDMKRMTLWAEETKNEPEQAFLVAPVPSSAKSETSGDRDNDAVPVPAPLGYLMAGNLLVVEQAKPFPPKTTSKVVRDPELSFVGLNERLAQMQHEPHNLRVEVVDVDSNSHAGPTKVSQQARPMLGSHNLSPDQDRFGDAKTVVASAANSEIHLPPTPRPLISFQRRQVNTTDSTENYSGRYSVS